MRPPGGNPRPDTLVRNLQSANTSRRLGAALALGTGSLALANVALAQTTWSDLSGLTSTAGAAGLSSTGSSMEQIIGTFIGTLIGLLGIVFVVLLVYGGFIWMTAQGSEEKIKKAKSIISSAVIGLVVVTMAYAIASFVVGGLNTALQGPGATVPTN